MISMFIITLFPKIVFNPLFLLKVFGNRKLQGFLPTALQFLKQYYNVPESNILPWQIYTQKDVQMQTTKTSSYTSGNQNVNNIK